jgi:CheY-like chemotaxis protein
MTLPTVRNETIMIIDDSETDRFMTSKILERARFAKSPMQYGFAQKALDFLKDNSADFTQLPQIILLDLNMPGMSGFDFIVAFDRLPQKLKNYCKVYMISATIKDDEIKNAGTYKNISGFHSKPITVAFVNGI